MKPYSVEFRQKIIEVREQENFSIRKLAERFCVAPSFVQKLLKQYKETGNIHPRPQGGSPEPKLKRLSLNKCKEDGGKRSLAKEDRKETSLLGSASLK